MNLWNARTAIDAIHRSLCLGPMGNLPGRWSWLRPSCSHYLLPSASDSISTLWGGGGFPMFGCLSGAASSGQLPHPGMRMIFFSSCQAGLYKWMRRCAWPRLELLHRLNPQSRNRLCRVLWGRCGPRPDTQIRQSRHGIKALSGQRCSWFQLSANRVLQCGYCNCHRGPHAGQQIRIFCHEI